MQARFTIPLLLGTAVLFFGAEYAFAQNVLTKRAGAQLTASVSATVPPIIKVVANAAIVGPDGAPLVRVVTNVRGLRGHPTPEGELLVAPNLRYIPRGRSVGGEDGVDGELQEEVGLIRFTITTP